MANRNLIDTLLDEKAHNLKGGIYHKLQVDFAYNSNHIEGSQLSHDQTQYIFETKTVGTEPAKVDDIFEAVNHFRCFDMILEHYKDPLSESTIKTLHKQLKTGTFSSQSKAAVVGDYKKVPNFVGNMETTTPAKVQSEIKLLLSEYNNKKTHTLDDILNFHAQYEKIHPFYDGNGRTGRLIMFKECLRNNIVPFIITDQYKGYYYRGLKEWQTGGEKGFLRDTCLLMQDNMKRIMDYFEIRYYGDS
ncbi:Fic family protein [Lachnospiraceae bacterium 48-42]